MMFCVSLLLKESLFAVLGFRRPLLSPKFERHFLCLPPDPCDTATCFPNSQCFVNNGIPMCRCLPGFQLLPIQRACIDVDECKANPCGQGALCENSIGSFRCKCPAGTSGDPSRQCVPTGALVVKCSSDSQVKQSLKEIMLWLCNFSYL